MNPVVKILTSLIISINKLIDSLSLQTIQTIRRGFFFAIFVFCIIGIVIGINMGKKSARIKSAPFAEYVNDTFKIDLSREQESGVFSEMLENEVIKDSPINNFQKEDFSVRDRIEPQYGKEPIDSGYRVPEPDIRPKPYRTETPVDEDLDRKISEPDSRINIIEKELTGDNMKDIIIKRTFEPEQETKTDILNEEKSPIRVIEKDKTEQPKIINRDSGVISQ